MKNTNNPMFWWVQSLSITMLLLLQACSSGPRQTEHIVTRDRGEQYTGISREDVRAVVAAGIPTIQNCYSRELRSDAKLAGKLVMKWALNETGQVTDVSVVKSLNSEKMESCVADTIRTWKFQKPGNGRFAEVTYPFVFYPNKNGSN